MRTRGLPGTWTASLGPRRVQGDCRLPLGGSGGFSPTRNRIIMPGIAILNLLPECPYKQSESSSTTKGYTAADEVRNAMVKATCQVMATIMG